MLLALLHMHSYRRILNYNDFISVRIMANFQKYIYVKSSLQKHCVLKAKTFDSVSVVFRELYRSSHKFTKYNFKTIKPTVLKD